MVKRPTSRTRRTKKASAPGAAKAKTKAAATQPGAGDSEEQPGEHLVPVVGVGASAGGLEAFTHLLEALPADTGMAFVLISHLSHTHKSMLSELLSKSTRMAVTEVSRRTRVEANHVYVIAPDADLALSDDGAITVRSAVKSRKPHMAIDHFFRSLAQHRKSQAIGVILSGTGTDGTLGLAAIRAEGGITFAQDDKSAKYPDMPRSASAGIGGADFVLSPDGIAREIARLARHPYVARKQRRASGAEVFTEPLDVPHQIFRVVRAATGVDFSEYKPGTIDRRISRRMAVHKIDALADYLKLLQSSPDEALALSHDLLINVTEFFRDPEAFDFLKKKVLPKIIKRRADGAPIRVWVPACASGAKTFRCWSGSSHRDTRGR